MEDIIEVNSETTEISTRALDNAVLVLLAAVAVTGYLTGKKIENLCRRIKRHRDTKKEAAVLRDRMS